MVKDKALTGNILVKLLKTISGDEWKDFEKFVSSPYFNEGRNYLPLIKILKKYHPEFNSEEFEKEKIYKKLFPGKKFKESVLNSMFSRLYNIGEEFLIHTAIKKDEHLLREKLIIKELRSRGVMLKLNKQIKSNLKFLEDKKTGLSDFKILRDLKAELLTLNEINGKSELLFDSMSDLIKYSTYSYFFEMNINQSSLYSYKNFWKEDYENNFLSRISGHIDFEKILEIVKKEDVKNYAPLRISYLSYMSTRFPENDEYYDELKSIYKKEAENFDKSLKEVILNNLWSLCAMKLVLGNREYKYESFEIRKMMVEENIFLLSDSYMKIGDFRSTFIDAMNVNQYEWGKMFVENYINKVHPDYRSDITNYCSSWLSYEKGDFDNAVVYAGMVNIDQIIFKLDMKNIISRIYYDTGSTESLYSHLSTYYQLIKNSDSRNKEYLYRHRKFIKHLRRLVCLRDKAEDKSEFELLRNMIERDNVSAKSWILSKVDEYV